MTTTVKVFIHERERMLGAMVKALSFEIGGPSSVKGAAFPVLEATGHYVFTFASVEQSAQFGLAVAKYFPGYLVHVVNEPGA